MDTSKKTLEEQVEIMIQQLHRITKIKTGTFGSKTNVTPLSFQKLESLTLLLTELQQTAKNSVELREVKETQFQTQEDLEKAQTLIETYNTAKASLVQTLQSLNLTKEDLPLDQAIKIVQASISQGATEYLNAQRLQTVNLFEPWNTTPAKAITELKRRVTKNEITHANQFIKIAQDYVNKKSLTQAWQFIQEIKQDDFQFYQSNAFSTDLKTLLLETLEKIDDREQFQVNTITRAQIIIKHSNLLPDYVDKHAERIIETLYANKEDFLIVDLAKTAKKINFLEDKLHSDLGFHLLRKHDEQYNVLTERFFENEDIEIQNEQIASKALTHYKQDRKGYSGEVSNIRNLFDFVLEQNINGETRLNVEEQYLKHIISTDDYTDLKTNWNKLETQKSEAIDLILNNSNDLVKITNLWDLFRTDVTPDQIRGFISKLNYTSLRTILDKKEENVGYTGLSTYIDDALLKTKLMDQIPSIKSNDLLSAVLKNPEFVDYDLAIKITNRAFEINNIEEKEADKHYQTINEILVKGSNQAKKGVLDTLISSDDSRLFTLLENAKDHVDTNIYESAISKLYDNPIEFNTLIELIKRQSSVSPEDSTKEINRSHEFKPISYTNLISAISTKSISDIFPENLAQDIVGNELKSRLTNKGRTLNLIEESSTFIAIQDYDLLVNSNDRVDYIVALTPNLNESKQNSLIDSLYTNGELKFIILNKIAELLTPKSLEYSIDKLFETDLSYNNVISLSQNNLYDDKLPQHREKIQGIVNSELEKAITYKQEDQIKTISSKTGQWFNEDMITSAITKTSSPYEIAEILVEHNKKLVLTTYASEENTKIPELHELANENLSPELVSTWLSQKRNYARIIELIELTQQEKAIIPTSNIAYLQSVISNKIKTTIDEKTNVDTRLQNIVSEVGEYIGLDNIVTTMPYLNAEQISEIPQDIRLEALNRTYESLDEDVQIASIEAALYAAKSVQEWKITQGILEKYPKAATQRDELITKYVFQTISYSGDEAVIQTINEKYHTRKTFDELMNKFDGIIQKSAKEKIVDIYTDCTKG